MTVILSPNDYDQWLDQRGTDAAVLQLLLDPYPAEEMTRNPGAKHAVYPKSGSRRQQRNVAVPCRFS
jgi:putative SOS response-associated peptidase YedK